MSDCCWRKTPSLLANQGSEAKCSRHVEGLRKSDDTNAADNLTAFQSCTRSQSTSHGKTRSYSEPFLHHTTDQTSYSVHRVLKWDTSPDVVWCNNSTEIPSNHHTQLIKSQLWDPVLFTTMSFQATEVPWPRQITKSQPPSQFIQAEKVAGFDLSNVGFLSPFQKRARFHAEKNRFRKSLHLSEPHPSEAPGAKDLERLIRQEVSVANGRRKWPIWWMAITGV